MMSDPEKWEEIFKYTIDQTSPDQAVQNMNLLFGLPENEGLQLAPMFP